MRRFAGSVVVVTGAANGIGRACVHRFAREGAQVALIDIDAASNAQAAAACVALGGVALPLECDVREAEQVERAIREVIAHWGRLDVLVTSAGIYSGQPLDEVPLRSWCETLETNLTGVFLCNRAVAPLMRERRSGSIVNISSMAGLTGFPATAQYASSKSGVIGLTRSVAMELAPHGVTVNAVCPGNTDTTMLHHVARTVAPTTGLTPEAWLQMRARDCPLQRFAQPEEIAGVVSFLASEDARYITGQALQVDGGMVLA